MNSRGELVRLREGVSCGLDVSALGDEPCHCVESAQLDLTVLSRTRLFENSGKSFRVVAFSTKHTAIE